MTRATVLALALLLSGPAHAQSAEANWQVQEGQSPLDDSRNVFLATQALEPTVGTLGLPVIPTLVVQCKENKTALYVRWETFVDTEDTLVTYRIDELPAERQRWRVSTDFTAAGLWNGATAIPFIKRLFGHDRLLVQVTPYGANPQTAVFNIQGIATTATPLMNACHWSAATPARQEPPKEDEFAALLRSVEETDRQREARLSIGEIDALRRQIGRCWTLPVGIEGIQDMVVHLRIQVRPDRTVQAITIQNQESLGREARAVADSARRAVEQCSPLNLPPGKYALWREIDIKFYPQDAISG